MTVAIKPPVVSAPAVSRTVISAGTVKHRQQVTQLPARSPAMQPPILLGAAGVASAGRSPSKSTCSASAAPPTSTDSRPGRAALDMRRRWARAAAASLGASRHSGRAAAVAWRIAGEQSKQRTTGVLVRVPVHLLATADMVSIAVRSERSGVRDLGHQHSGVMKRFLDIL